MPKKSWRKFDKFTVNQYHCTKGTNDIERRRFGDLTHLSLAVPVARPFGDDHLDKPTYVCMYLTSVLMQRLKTVCRWFEAQMHHPVLAIREAEFSNIAPGAPTVCDLREAGYNIEFVPIVHTSNTTVSFCQYNYLPSVHGMNTTIIASTGGVQVKCYNRGWLTTEVISKSLINRLVYHYDKYGGTGRV